MKIGITADCSSCLEYFPHKHQVKITRTAIHFKEETLIDGIDITADAFYEKLKSSEVVPSTSAPTPGEILKQVEAWKKEGATDIIHFPISFGLSTYGENLQSVGSDMFEGINLYVYNTKTATIMEGYLAYYAEILAKNNYTVEEIFSELDKLRDNYLTFFVVDDLKYLVRNGRLNAASGVIGNLIGIKPILELNKEGKIVPYEKVRTHGKAINRMFELIKENSKEFKKVVYLILHTGRPEEAQALKARVEEEMKNIERVEVSVVTPTVGAHIGYGILGMSRLVLDDLDFKI